MNNARIELRLPNELKQKLRQEAAKQSRSVNNLIRFIINEYLKKLEV